MSEESKVSAADVKAAGNAALGDSIAVLVKPDEAIPKAVGASGFIGSGIIAGAYVIIITLLFLFGTKVQFKAWPDFEMVLKEFFGQIVFVGLLAGGIFVCANMLFEKMNIGVDKALNAVAVALVPVIVVGLVLFVLKVIWDWPIPYVAPLQTIALVVFLMGAIQGGLGMKPGVSLYSTLLTFFVANFIYSLISDAGQVDAVGAMMQQMGNAFGGF
jgi:hypothetical protein